MIGLFDAHDDATPLTPEERNGLVPTHISLRNELNELEQKNIAEADRWAFSRKHKILDEPFLRGLHRRMFNHVWKWAGTYRTTEFNLGIESYRIHPELVQIIDDARYWSENKTYSPDELAVRFHHRLVLVHPLQMAMVDGLDSPAIYWSINKAVGGSPGAAQTLEQRTM